MESFSCFSYNTPDISGLAHCSLISQKVFANLADTFSRIAVKQNNCKFQLGQTRHISYHCCRFHNKASENNL